MCKFCRHSLTPRWECGILAICVILLCIAILVYLCTRDHFGLYHKIGLGVACFALFAAICLLMGCILESQILVWIWIVIMLAVIVATTVFEIVRLCKGWNSLGDRTKTYEIIFIIVAPCLGLFMLYETMLYAWQLKRKRSEEQQHGYLYVLRGC
ncbi:uncharacterized protein LOC108029435 [Drosophila biarmipes]|uniref:uncharacterized protein LOC108029435 n=1 Tax=Drosophila biarmipes TaxID=125945 RepID=UPI0007E5E16C|nr:uncharacterized protein LOC108029435 [Drosophila biarmipes]